MAGHADIRGKQVGAIGPLLLGPPGSKVSMVLERTEPDSELPKVALAATQARTRQNLGRALLWHRATSSAALQLHPHFLCRRFRR